MSNIQRKLFLKKIAEAEQALNLATENDEEQEEEDQDGLGELPSFFYGSKPHSTSSLKNTENKEKVPDSADDEDDLKPVPWTKYFEKNEQYLDEQGNQFNTYFTPPNELSRSPVFIFHHGAGSCGLSFALLTANIRSQMQSEADALPDTPLTSDDKGVAGAFTFDARGHGFTKVVNTKDYSIDTFINDFVFVVNELGRRQNWTKENSPPIVLVGHSLGGSIVTKAVCSGRIDLNIVGLAIFDVVEEVAVSALNGMHHFLEHRPTGFKNFRSAVAWHLKSKTLRKRESALVSIQGVVDNITSTDGKYNWSWITNLYDTEPYWENWFTGLSEEFLSAHPAKLLILAGTDNLDKALMIGQMQGKYQLVVFNDTGHFIQEDGPEKTAITLIDFWRRNDKVNTMPKPLWGEMRK